MYRLPAEHVLKLWVSGMELHPIEKAITILAAALPEKTPDELAKMPLGQRNRYLMALREAHFGKQLQCLVDCNHCHDSLEFSLDMTLLYPDTDKPVYQQTMSIGDYYITFRPLNSFDLAAALKQSDQNLVQRFLVQACLLEVSYRNKILAHSAFPDHLIEPLAEQIKAADPLAEILLPFNCPICKQRSEVLFDIAAYLWDELIAELKQALQEVHVLASTYGWSESDILAMSAKHRQFYLHAIRT